jgi:hypothetical protein
MGSSALSTGVPLRTCARCAVPYDWRKSSSWTLKMTYCSALCERGDLGFSLETFFRGTQIERFAWRDVAFGDFPALPPEAPSPLLLA